jgi:hypothetical protein
VPPVASFAPRSDAELVGGLHRRAGRREQDQLDRVGVEIDAYHFGTAT